MNTSMFVSEDLLHETLYDNVLFPRMIVSLEISFNRELYKISYQLFMEGKCLLSRMTWSNVNLANLKKSF